MATTIQIKRGDAASWTSANPILAVGEMGMETDTRKFKFGDGVTAWNDLEYASSEATGSGVRSGSATLAAGSATVVDALITSQSVINVTPQSAPSTPGTALYVDPADYVAATSFVIRSDDGSDTRAVFWMAAETDTLPPLSLPITFYVSFVVSFSADEITADDPSPMFELGDVGTANAIWIMADLNAAGQWTEVFIQLFGGGQPYAVTLDAATSYTFDLKFEFAVDYTSCTVTPRIDGTPLTEGAVTASTGFGSILAFGLGGTSQGSRTDKRDYDSLTIGTSTWGDNDLFDSQFDALEPFDSQVGSGTTITGGFLSLDKVGSPAYVKKNCA